MNIKEIFDNMNDCEKAGMLKLFAKEKEERQKEERQIKKDFKNIIYDIQTLNSDNPKVIRKLAMKFQAWCEWNKYFDFSYHIIAPQGYSIYVLIKMEEERIMTASKFCEFITEQLESFAETQEYTKDVVYEWKKETETLTRLGELSQ